MRKNFASWMTILVFFGALAAVPVLNLLLPDHASSVTENRALTQRPVNGFSDLSALTQAYTDYVVDQFPARERLLKAYTALELAQGKDIIRNVVIADGDYLLNKSYALENVTYFSWDLNAATKANPGVDYVYAILPAKTSLLSGLSPYDGGEIDAANRETLLSVLPNITGMDYIDVSHYLCEQFPLEERQELFYRTDSHWNSRGAFLAAEYIAGQLAARGLLDGAVAPCAEDFLWQELGGTHQFEGDLNRRFSYLLSTQEAIPHYSLRDTSQIRYYLSTDDSEPVARNAILGTGLQEKVLNYNGFSTYNLGYYRVENPNARSDRHVIIFKDSYQNPTTDYFTELFSVVTVIDPRYYEEPLTFRELLAQSGASLVLFLYNQNNTSVDLREFLTRQ